MNTMDYIEISAKTIEEAVRLGSEQLSKENKIVTDTKVLEEPSSGFLGFGKKDALVRLYFEEIPVKEEVTLVETEILENKTTDVESNTKEVEEKPQITKEEQAEIAEKGKQFLSDMLEQMGLTVQIEKMSNPSKITYQIHGEDLGILIGKHGQTLDAIQYLTNLIANKEMKNRCQIIVDVENYRSRREETLTNLAHRLASKVRRTRQKVSLEPMNAFERKIIHLALQEEHKIVTHSEGDEPYRHVVIAYKR